MKAMLLGPIMGLSLFVSPLFADDPAPGFALEDLPSGGQSITATLSNGSFLAFDGLRLDLIASNGNQIRSLGSLQGFTFGSFLKIAPLEEFAILGESGQGNIYRVEIDGSGISLITSLAFNYDAVFESQNSIIVSAATAGFGFGNDLLRVNLSSGQSNFLVHVAGASGPVALDKDGSLFYGSSSAVFPAPAGSTQILRFERGLIDGPGPLDESDASLVSAGFSNATSLAFDPLHGDLFLAEVNSALGLNQIRRVGPSEAQSATILTGDNGTFLSNLEFQQGDGQSKMRAFQSEDGGSLYYNNTDFSVRFQRTRLSPQRAQLDITGPGTLGVGQVDIAVFGAQPNGTAFLFYCPSSDVIAPQFAINLRALDFPLLFGLNPASVMLLPNTISLDSDGNGQLSLINTSGQTNFLAVQALHSSNPGFKGTSTLVKI